jgi:hypothetical protein
MSRTLRLPKPVVRKGQNDKVRSTKVHEPKRPRHEPTVAEGIAEAVASVEARGQFRYEDAEGFDDYWD